MAIVAGKIDSFCINADETLIYAGNNSGEILLIDVPEWKVINRFQANLGTITVMAIHKSLPYIASLGMDRSITVWEIRSPSALSLVSRFSIRNIHPWNDLEPYGPGRTEAQPLAFHPTKKRLVTKNASSALLELSFEDDKMEVLQCTRMDTYGDLMTVRYHSENEILSGSQGKVILSNHKTILKEWDFEERNIHWFEPMGDSTYLIASDEFRVYRFDLNDDNKLVTGPVITRDDLEHVTYNKTSKRAFIAGFDRNVYEINIEDCSSKGIAFHAPFKMRWIKSLENDPDKLIIQCRNGGLYKVSLSQKKINSTIKETANALWTSDFDRSGNIIIAGDGGSIYKMEMGTETDIQSRIPSLKFSILNDSLDPTSYTKRLVIDGDNIYIGRTDGNLYVLNSTGLKLLANTGSAIRDLSFYHELQHIFVALENGSVLMINASTGEQVSAFKSNTDQPIWSIAFNEKLKYLTVGENGGAIHIIDVSTGKCLQSIDEAARPKRMKWIDDTTLLFNRIGDLMRLDCNDWMVTEHVGKIGNTIEDFIVDPVNRYLLIISYTFQIILCDLDTGDILDTSFDQCDYSKGISWLYNKKTSGRQYPLDFITYGRSGECHFYRILNESIISLSRSIGPGEQQQ